MKELVFNTGGRKLFNEDLDAIQILSKTIESFYAEELPFVISGVALTLVSGTTYNIGSGYVWLGGRVRAFAGASNVNLGTTTYINISDVSESTEYNDAVTRVSAIDYKTVLSTSLLSTTNSLQISITGTRNYVNNVLGSKYVMLTPATTGQTVEGNITLRNATLTSVKFGASGQQVSSVNTSLTVPKNDTSLSSNKVMAAHMVPKGAIMMWSGAIGDVPEHWTLCDGKAAVNGQIIPNLSGKFIVGYNSSDTDFNAIGKSAGVKDAELTIDDIPSHTHGINLTTYGGEHTHFISADEIEKSGQDSNNIYVLEDSGTDGEAGGKSISISGGAHGHIIAGSTNSNGNGSITTHENLPPYYTLAYIIKTI